MSLKDFEMTVGKTCFYLQVSFCSSDSLAYPIHRLHVLDTSEIVLKGTQNFIETTDLPSSLAGSGGTTV